MLVDCSVVVGGSEVCCLLRICCCLAWGSVGEVASATHPTHEYTSACDPNARRLVVGRMLTDLSTAHTHAGVRNVNQHGARPCPHPIPASGGRSLELAVRRVPWRKKCAGAQQQVALKAAMLHSSEWIGDYHRRQC